MGKYVRVPYGEGEIDYFFIVTAGGQKYLVPLAVVSSLGGLVLDEKYQDFVV
jgi:hypothetical protein